MFFLTERLSAFSIILILNVYDHAFLSFSVARNEESRSQSLILSRTRRSAKFRIRTISFRHASFGLNNCQRLEIFPFHMSPHTTFIDMKGKGPADLGV